MKRPRHLSLAVISYSPVNRDKYGIQKHMEAEGFQVMLFAYAVDREAIQVIDFTKKERVPSEIVYWLASPLVQKHAFDIEYVKKIAEVQFHFEVSTQDSSWKSTGSLVQQYGFPVNELLLYEKLGLEGPKCNYIDICLQRFCEPEHISIYGRRIYPKEFPALWRNVVRYCEWLVYMERSVRQHFKKYPKSEIVALQEETKHWYHMKKEENAVFFEISCPYIKYVDESKLYRAIRFVVQFNECIWLDNFRIKYRNKCLWIISPNGSFLLYVNPVCEERKQGRFRYERYCTEKGEWETRVSDISSVVDDLYKLTEHEYRVLVAMQCLYHNICAKVVDTRLCVAIKPGDEDIIKEIMERTRMDG